MKIPNILAERYASSEMQEIWSPEGKILYERMLWISVLKAQKDQGIQVSEGAIEAYESVLNQIHLDSIQKREAATRHDVKARIEEFCALAGYEEIHRGMTSRDLTENVEQLQIYKSLQVVQKKCCATLMALSRRAAEYLNVVITARTHNVPAQPTSMGKRIAMFGEELLQAARQLDFLVESYPVRGLKGAVGTQLDLQTLGGSHSGFATEVEERMLENLGIKHKYNAVGQVYPRSLDHAIVSSLVTVASGPSNLARSLRLMAGHETASEGFAPGQTGSSAMPHKMNSRSCERVNGFLVLLRGYEAMTAGLAGDQWHEGDVSCSVVRRVALPDAFFAIDGMFETFLTVLSQMEIYPSMIEAENEHYFPFLSSTTLLMEAVRAGAGREAAHKAIKKHAVEVVKDMREGKISENNLAGRLGQDSDFPLDTDAIEDIIRSASTLTGAAQKQVHTFEKSVHEHLCTHNPEWARYRPAPIL